MTQEEFDASAIGTELDNIRERLSSYTKEQLLELENRARSQSRKTK